MPDPNEFRIRRNHRDEWARLDRLERRVDVLLGWAVGLVGVLIVSALVWIGGVR